MGRRTGTNYHPKTHAMHWAMAQNESNRERQWDVMKRKYLRSAYWLERLAIAMDALRTADLDWETWYDNDNNVPALATKKSHALIIEARIKELTGRTRQIATAILHRDVFIWNDDKGAFVFSRATDSSIAKSPKLHWLLFNNADEARKFVDGLDIKNLDYGYVLDIMTMPANLVPVAPVVKNVRGN